MSNGDNFFWNSIQSKKPAQMLGDCGNMGTTMLTYRTEVGVLSLHTCSSDHFSHFNAKAKKTIDSYPDSIDFVPGSVSNFTNMNQENSWNNIFAPTENQLPNFLISSGEPDCTFGNAASHEVRTFNGWGSDEPSSSSNPPNRVISDGSEMEDTWSSSFNVHDGAGHRSEERRFESTNMRLFERGNVDSNVNRNEPFFFNNSSSDCFPQTENRSLHIRDTDARLGYNMGRSHGSESEQKSPACVSFRNVGSSSGISGSSLDEKEGSSSLGSWGSSCKRKSLEGTSGSGQSYPGSSSSCFTQVPNNVYHADLARQSASRSLSMPTPLGTSSSGTTAEHSNPRDVFSMEEAMDEFPPLRATENSESPFRSFNQRMNSGHQQDPSTFNLSNGGSSRRSTFPGTFQIPTTRPLSYSESLDLRSASASRSATQNLSTIMNESGFSRSTHPLRGSGASLSRTESSSSSINLSADRGRTLQDDLNFAWMTRNTIHTDETRDSDQDPWNAVTGDISSQIGASSTSHTFTPPWPSWIPHPNTQIPNNERLSGSQTPNNQRLSGFSPWTLFPSADSEPGGPSGNLPPLSSGTSTSSQENSRGNRRARLRSVFQLERQGNDVAGMSHSLRALAADIEGRHMLISEIRQVLSAMRRGENLRPEDYMFFDPLIFHGLPEIHDTHRDMRLDVDNMSYEELLALGERIGDVKTGLTEETILKIMKQRKFSFISTRNSIHIEPCSVCQEEYVGGDNLGTLECGHDFHTDCIKEWLMQKNLCPICKATGLNT